MKIVFIDYYLLLLLLLFVVESFIRFKLHYFNPIGLRLHITIRLYLVYLQPPFTTTYILLKWFFHGVCRGLNLLRCDNYLHAKPSISLFEFLSFCVFLKKLYSSCIEHIVFDTRKTHSTLFNKLFVICDNDWFP